MRHNTTVRIVVKGESVFENLIQEKIVELRILGQATISPSWREHVVAGVERDLDVSSITEALPIPDPFSHQALSL
jgi:hypothetical protein